MNMSATDFFNDMNKVSNFLFNIFKSAWDVISSNWLLLLSFAVLIFASFVSIFRYIKNRHH